MQDVSKALASSVRTTRLLWFFRANVLWHGVFSKVFALLARRKMEGRTGLFQGVGFRRATKPPLSKQFHTETLVPEGGHLGLVSEYGLARYLRGKEGSETGRTGWVILVCRDMIPKKVLNSSGVCKLAGVCGVSQLFLRLSNIAFSLKYRARPYSDCFDHCGPFGRRGRAHYFFTLTIICAIF